MLLKHDVLTRSLNPLTHGPTLWAIVSTTDDSVIGML